MKKNTVVWVIVVIVVVVVAGGAAALFLGKKDSSDQSMQGGMNHSGMFSAKVVDACKVLTPEVATKYLGETPQTDNTQDSGTSSDDINVSNCIYSTKYVAGSAASIRSASLLARSAKTKDGADSNKDQFAKLPDGAQAVSGYGDSAYWDPSFGQLNILKHNNWYIVTGGSSKVADRTLDDAKKLADLIVADL